MAWGLLQRCRLMACILHLPNRRARVTKYFNFARYRREAAVVAWGLLHRRRLLACVLLLRRMHSSCRTGNAMWG
eukprot:CAMPEP_0179048524 /NCGR_PEP_ID=MMETSP0796-20121207/19752_1 /TAXON_ID=73915 /ORGANISM="Pyrodinium bahamense, Strain pbaha01" /LENGTH=73 /DNA_ID=CAMNT_0020744993 /DNA_START=11 /DNA_END=229 /DNA_ORIENTATION=+